MKIRCVALSIVAILASTECPAQSAVAVSPVEAVSPQQASLQAKPVDLRTDPAILDSLLADLRNRITPAQYQIFANAIQMSPPLSAQLRRLITEGLLNKISIANAPQQNWQAWRDGSTWFFVPEFVDTLAPHRIFDIARQDDVLPENMSFVLGYLASRTEQTAQLPVDSPISRTSNTPMSTEEHRNQWIERQIRTDARAYIQGWNDMLSAATMQNQGIPLTGTQMANMMMNFQFREPFLMQSLAILHEKLNAEQTKASEQATGISYAPSESYRLDMRPDGIPMDERNIDAMTTSLKRSHLIPVKP